MPSPSVPTRSCVLKNLLILLFFSEIAGVLLASCELLAAEDWCSLAVVAAIAGLCVRRPWQRSTLTCVTAVCVGAFALSMQLEGALWPYAGSSKVEKTIEGRVTRVVEGPGWRRLRLEEVVDGATPSSITDVAPPRRLELRWDQGEVEEWVVSSAQVGDRIRAQVRLRPLHGVANPGGRDRERQLRRQGVGASAYLVDPGLAVKLVDSPDRWSRVRAWRARLRGNLLSMGHGSGLVVALVLGERSGLSPEERAAFAQLGLSHLLAVSGLHLGMVASASFLLFRFFLARVPRLPDHMDIRPLAAWLALGVAIGYAALAGWGLPVRRSLIILLALVIGLAIGRVGSRFHPLAAAGLFLLWREPQLLFNPGAQMSFAVSAALLWMSSPVSAAAALPVWIPVMAPVLNGLHRCFRVSLVALAASSPITAQAFGAVVPMAALWNLIAVPLTGFVLLPGALLLSAAVATLMDMSSMECAAFYAQWTPWVEVLWGRSLDLVLVLAPRSPLLMTNTQVAWPWLCASLGLALVTARVRRTRWKVLSAGLSCAVLSGAPVPSMAPEPPRIAFLDVGQGDAILIQGREATLLIDAGNSFVTGGSMGEFVVLPALRAMKVSQLDLLIASHADRDHQGGLAAVLRGVRVGALWLPYGGMKDPAFAALRQAALEEKVPIEERGSDGLTQTVGDLRIETLWPPPQNSGYTRNNRSLVLRVEVSGLTLLLPGDLERAGERELLRSGRSLKADWLKLGHHGSQTSSTRAFLKAVDAKHALVSVPCSGRFDMPHASVVQRLAEEGIQMWWTGRDGAVLVGATGGVSTWRGASAGCPGRGNL